VRRAAPVEPLSEAHTEMVPLLSAAALRDNSGKGSDHA
jgi:hypothetical protein